MSKDDDLYFAAEEIRNQAVHLNVASQNWDKAWRNIRAAELPADALGGIGADADYVNQFNSYAEEVTKKLWRGSEALGSGVNGLHQVANNYERNEIRTTRDVKSSNKDSRPDLGR